MTISNKLSEFMHKKIHMLDKDEPYSVAARAKLRRSIGKPLDSVPDVWDIVLSYEEDLNQAAILSAYTTIGLYALHRQGKTKSMNAKDISFGSAIAQLVSNDDQKNSVTRKFNAVATSTDFSELSHHARSLIQMLKANDIEMDYPRFARELYRFQFSESTGRVRLRWGEDFYQGIYKKEKGNDKNDENKG